MARVKQGKRIKTTVSVKVRERDGVALLIARKQFKEENPGTVRSFEEFQRSFDAFQKVERQFNGSVVEPVTAQVGARLRV